MIESNFDATVDRAHTAPEAIQLACANSYDLIMINRLLDVDRSSGVALVGSLKEEEVTASVPVMLISNYQDAQREAESAGAAPGFGKSALDDSNTIALVSKYLNH